MPSAFSDDEKIDRYKAFWTRAETDRPLIGTTINPLPSVRAVKCEGIISPDDLDIDENIRELEEEWEQWKGASGDAIWSASPVWGFHWLTAMAGCPNERRGNTVWIHPGLNDWKQLDNLRPDRSNPWFVRLMEFIQALIEHSGGRYPVAVPALGTCADLMMHIRGLERLALDLHDSPEMVVRLSERCISFCTDVINAAYEAVPPHLGGYAGTIRFFWAPGEIIETAEDLSIMMSPANHQRFIVPIHRTMASRYPYNILHLHSGYLHTIDNVLDIEEVTAVQITPDFGADLRPFIPLMARILERKPLLIHGVMTAEEMKDLMRALTPRGLCLFCRCNSPEEGASILDAVL